MVSLESLQTFAKIAIPSTSAALHEPSRRVVSPKDWPSTKKSIEAITPEPVAPGGAEAVELQPNVAMA